MPVQRLRSRALLDLFSASRSPSACLSPEASTKHGIRAELKYNSTDRAAILDAHRLCERDSTSSKNALSPLRRASADGRRTASRDDLLPHRIHPREIEHHLRRWAIPVADLDPDLPWIGQQAQELRGVSSKQCAAAARRHAPSFLRFRLVVELVGHHDVLAARRLP